jgi:hypothetical protein
MGRKGGNPMTERRFTDREVALILRRSVEIEERSQSKDLPAARGLTLKELQEVAGEVGLDPTVVSRAAAELESKRGLEPASAWGPSTVRREVQAVPKELSGEEMAELIRVVDREVSAQGTVAEALGEVRWTSNTRFLNTQVSLEPGSGETLVRVEERYSDMVRGPLHGIPAGYAAMLGLVLGIEVFSVGPAMVALFVVLSAVVGWMVGDLIWRGVSSGSRKRVHDLSAELSEAAAGFLQEGESGESP